MDEEALRLSMKLRDMLQSDSLRVVFAESCTAGRVSATLAAIPGMSQWLCGSFVVYRCESKTRWLGIPNTVLTDINQGPVSQVTSNLLARAALAKTPEASIGVSVTGDVGPNAPRGKDGRIFCALATRKQQLFEAAFQLASPEPRSADDILARIARLNEATRLLLSFAIHSLHTLHRPAEQPSTS